MKIETIDELYQAIEKIGTATSHQVQAGKLIKDIQIQILEIKDKCSDADKVKTLWTVQPDPLRVAGTDTFINELIELIGGVNAIGATIQQYPPVSSEEVLTCGAEVIIHSAMGEKNIEDQQKTTEIYWNRFATLPAVKNKRVYVIESDTILRLGPRLPEGVNTIARCLHPELFQNEQ